MLCIFMAIGVGFRYLRPQNFSPFLTNGIGGLYKGTSAVSGATARARAALVQL